MRPALLMLLLSGCALLRSTPETVPEPSPTARQVWLTAPGTLGKERQFQAQEWLDRLVCESAEQPAWERLEVKGTLERYRIDCFSEEALTISIDVSGREPEAPKRMRLLDPPSYAQYLLAMAAAEKKEWEEALGFLSSALALAPEEPLYRLGRLAVLYAAGRPAEVAVEAEALVRRVASPMAWKYRAIAMGDIGLKREVLKSLDGLLESTNERHPLFPEAVCARGLIRIQSGEEVELAREDLEKGCALGEAACCAMNSR